MIQRYKSSKLEWFIERYKKSTNTQISISSQSATVNDTKLKIVIIP